MYYTVNQRCSHHQFTTRANTNTRQALENTMLSLNSMLGHANPAENENTTLLTAFQDCRDKLALLGDAGITKPKQMLDFTRDLVHKSGQQIECFCMFCPNKKISSTGATRVVDHYLTCPLCPKEIKEACQALRAGTAEKRSLKSEGDALATEESLEL